MRGGQAGDQTKVHFKGDSDDFIVIAESAQAVREWRQDKTVPLAQVVNGWKVFVTHKQGAQGIMDTASHAQLDSQFGTHRDDDVVAQILEKGDIVESESKSKQGDRNASKGPMSGSAGHSSNNHG